MAQLFPVNPIVEELNSKSDTKLVFTPLIEEEYTNLKKELDRFQTFPKLSPKREELDKELKKKHKIKFSDIVALGDTKLETRLANQYIENNILRCVGVDKRNYKCFVHNDWRQLGQMALPNHEDGRCSWNCLMRKLGEPKFGVIYNITSNDN